MFRIGLWVDPGVQDFGDAFGPGINPAGSEGDAENVKNEENCSRACCAD